MEISEVILNHEDMRKAVAKFLSEVLDGHVYVNNIRLLKGQRGFAVNMAVVESECIGEGFVTDGSMLPPRGIHETNPFTPEDAHPNASRYPIAEEG